MDETALRDLLNDTFGQGIQKKFEEQTGKNMVGEIIKAKNNQQYSSSQQYIQSKPDSLLQLSPFQTTPMVPRWLIIWVVLVIIVLGMVVYLFFI